ncbi:MAG TPA: tyrosinase family protein, partial [Myxococcaceae bacterium]
QWRVALEQDPGSGELVSVNRGLNREFGAGPSPRLPKRQDVQRALDGGRYDSGPWSRSASPSFRNDLEGWSPPAPGLHNLVHVWVGGDMLASTSPNDPVFYLNHCNVDRFWAAWQEENGTGDYAPAQRDPTAPAGHRPGDRLFVLEGDAPRISETFDVSEIYSYDTLGR